MSERQPETRLRRPMPGMRMLQELRKRGVSARESSRRRMPLSNERGTSIIASEIVAGAAARWM
jgi:hypothetical protein